MKFKTLCQRTYYLYFHWYSIYLTSDVGNGSLLTSLNVLILVMWCLIPILHNDNNVWGSPVEWDIAYVFISIWIIFLWWLHISMSKVTIIYLSSDRNKTQIYQICDVIQKYIGYLTPQRDLCFQKIYKEIFLTPKIKGSKTLPTRQKSMIQNSIFYYIRIYQCCGMLTYWISAGIVSRQGLVHCWSPAWYWCPLGSEMLANHGRTASVPKLGPTYTSAMQSRTYIYGRRGKLGWWRLHSAMP